MSLTDKFLVNTENFEPILDELRTSKNLPEQLNKEYFNKLGYNNPSDLLVLSMFKELNMLEDDGTPTNLFDKFREESTSDEALATGIVTAYADLFEDHPSIYRKSNEILIDVFREYFGTEKSDLILKYMTNTFRTLVDYAGVKNVESILKNKLSVTSSLESVIKEIAERHRNNNFDIVISNNEVSIADSESNETNLSKEEMGNAEIDDFIPPASFDKKENELDEIEGNDEEKYHPILDFMDDPEILILNKDKTGIEMDSINFEGMESETEINQTDSEKNLIDTNADLDNMKRKINGSHNSTEKGVFINKALIKKANLLYKLGKYKEALPALDVVFERFSDVTSAEFNQEASRALVKKMKIIEKDDELDNHNLLSVYSNVIDRLADSDHEEFTEEVDHAFIQKTELLLDSDNPEESLKTIDEAIKRFKNAKNKSDFLQKTMFMKGQLLEETGKEEEAVSAYEELIETFEEDQ